MTLDSVLELLRRRPFEPFLVITSSGERYEVRHPESALPIRNGLYIGLGTKEIPERAAFVSLLHISSLETLPGNATRRRR